MSKIYWILIATLAVALGEANAASPVVPVVPVVQMEHPAPVYHHKRRIVHHHPSAVNVTSPHIVMANVKPAPEMAEKPQVVERVIERVEQVATKVKLHPGLHHVLTFLAMLLILFGIFRKKLVSIWVLKAKDEVSKVEAAVKDEVSKTKALVKDEVSKVETAVEKVIHS